ncbi:MAG: efflux RND transporter periplasmic adaptor subunit [Cyclobacteriaceae bacterium]|nr:efflux RND transporter periplasmic adaptor subunit [Cyclobacteriaceae bacterium]
MKNINFFRLINKINSVAVSVLVISWLLTISSCASKTEISTEAAIIETSVTLSDAQSKNANLLTGNIEKKSLSSLLKVNGRIDVPPQNLVSVSVPMGGYLKHTKLMPGMHLSKGEVIAVMEDQQYIQLQQDYLTAMARLNFMTSEYQRQKELNQSKASSDKVFQQTEADYMTTKINAKSLAERLQLIGVNPDKLNENTISKSINIYSPIDGYVSKVNVNIGKYTQPSEELFELINPADIHLALTVFEKDLGKLYIGQKVFAYTNNNPDNRHECEIILIGKNLSNERSTEVHSHFEKYDKSLIPGMYMNAEIEIKSHDAYALPDAAIVRFENIQYIFIEDKNNSFTIQAVETGESENGYTEIRSGEKLVDKNIVVQGAYTLLMVMKNKAEE